MGEDWPRWKFQGHSLTSLLAWEEPGRENIVVTSVHHVFLQILMVVVFIPVNAKRGLESSSI